jgi:hypothetical protein
MLPCGMFLLVLGLKEGNFGIMVKYGKSGRRVNEVKIVGRGSVGGSLWVGGVGWWVGESGE